MLLMGLKSLLPTAEQDFFLCMSHKSVLIKELFFFFHDLKVLHLS